MSEERKRRRSGRPRSGRSRGALSTKTRSAQRDAGGSHLGVRHLEQAVAFSLAPASLAACCVETSLRASDLFEFELPPPVERQILDLVLAGAAEAMSEKRNPGDTLAARAARSAGAAIRWSLELQQRPPDADVIARLLEPLENAKRWLMLADLHEEFASDGWTAALEAAARSALAAATTSATCLGWPPTNDEHVRCLSRRSHLDLATRLAAGSPPLQLPLLRYLASQLLAGACERVDGRLLGTLRALLRWPEAAADAVADDGAADDPGGRDSLPSRARQRAAAAALIALWWRCARSVRRHLPLGLLLEVVVAAGHRPLPLLHAASDGDGGDAPPRAGARSYLWWVLVAETLPAARLPRIFDGGDADVAMRTALPLAAAAAATSRLLTDRDALSAADGALQAIQFAAQLRTVDAPVLRERLVARLGREWCGRPLQFGALAHAELLVEGGMRGGTREEFTHGSDDAPRAEGRLLIVHSVDDVEEARRLLAGARVVGVDVEGVTRRGQPMLPVLLQLGTAHAAILIDLLESTDATAAAGKLVGEVLASPAVVKVGVNLVKDVDELFDEAPSLGLARGRCCATRLVDLSGAFASALGVSHADAIGLKRLALLLLGLKLDRAMARSDWSCRPLSDAQVNYAAVDAQAGARCFDAIEEIARAGLDVRVDARSGGGVACSVRYAGVLL